MAFSALSLPGTRLAREHGCTCRTVDMASFAQEYGTRPVFDVDAWCPVHGLSALTKENA